MPCPAGAGAGRLQEVASDARAVPSPHIVSPHPRVGTITRWCHVASLCRPVEAPMARLGSPGCHVDVCLRRGGEEAGLVVSTSLPQPTAFEQLRRRENEILKSGLQPTNDRCSAIRVNNGKAARGASCTP